MINVRNSRFHLTSLVKELKKFNYVKVKQKTFQRYLQLCAVIELYFRYKAL